MRQLRRLSTKGIVVALTAWLCVGWSHDGWSQLEVAVENSSSEPSPIEFVRDIAPIFERHCLRCHNADNSQGEVSLATAKDLQELGYLRGMKDAPAYLIELISHAPGDAPKMPKEGQPLSAKQIETLSRWVSAGAAWPKEAVLELKSKADKSWWAFQPLQTNAPPAVANAPEAWRINPIDAYIWDSLRQATLRPNPPAERRALIRRATYDLTGLPPTPDEVEAFAQDESANAYENLLDRLLASPRYGEHWGRHWLDVARFGESNGFERNVTIDGLWPFRDYIIQSFNDDKPFTQLVREHLAGDLLAEQQPERTRELAVGTSFLVCGPYDDVGNQDAVQAAQIRANTLDEIIRATGEAFLGLTIGCARCHNHKFDSITQADYHSLHATFAGVRHGGRSVASPAEQAAYRQLLEPLERRISELKQRKEILESELQTQARAIEADLAKAWLRPAIQRTGVEDRFTAVAAKFVRMKALSTDENPDSNEGFKIDEFEAWTDESPPRNVALAELGGKATGASRTAGDFAEAYSAELTIDGRFGARWIAAEPTLVIEFAKVERIGRVVFSSDREGAAPGDGKSLFVGEYTLEVSLDGKQWREIASSADRLPVSEKHRRARLLRAVAGDGANHPQRETLAEIDRQLAEERRQHAAIPTPAHWWVGNFSPAPGPFHIFLGGDPQRRGAEIVPASLSVFDGTTPLYRLTGQESEAQRRLKLADWLTHERNPLPARVLANRLWHYHFGTGIVDTPSDFGSMGGLPSHPELLEFLALEVQRQGWRIKPLHKLIMLSATYRQASDFREDAAAEDSAARMLWRFPPRRLSAEEVRDTMLFAAGQLDLRMGGPGFRLYKYLQDNVATYVPLETHGPETYRRAIYHQNARAALVDLVSDFDGPDCASAAPRRATTTTPMQALTLLNHRFTLDMARYLAERLQREAGDDVAARIARAFVLLYGRQPTAEEISACQQLANEAGMIAVCRALLNTNEMLYID